VDQEVLIPAGSHKLQAGCFYEVKITRVGEFELFAAPAVEK